MTQVVLTDAMSPLLELVPLVVTAPQTGCGKKQVHLRVSGYLSGKPFKDLEFTGKEETGSPTST